MHMETWKDPSRGAPVRQQGGCLEFEGVGLEEQDQILQGWGPGVEEHGDCEGGVQGSI